jgi:hypothetical protein
LWLFGLILRYFKIIPLIMPISLNISLNYIRIILK